MNFMFGLTRVKIILCLSIFLLAIIFSLNFSTNHSQSQEATVNSPPKEIIKGWQYHWGDIPLDSKGRINLAAKEISVLDWHSFSFPKKLNNIQGKQILWLRVSLPKSEWKSPYLYLQGIPNILNTYLDNQPIYQQLALNSTGKANYQDYQLPIVPLEADFPGKTLLFRIYVNNSTVYLGLFERVAIGTQTALIKRLLTQIIEAILAVFLILISFIVTIIAFKRQEKKAYLYFGLLATLISLYTLSRSDTIVFVFKNLWELNYLETTSLYLIPVSTCLLFEELFGSGYKFVIRRLWQVNLFYTFISLLLIATNVISRNDTIHFAQFLFLLSAANILLAAVKISLQGDSDAKLFMSGFIIITLCSVNDILIYRLGAHYFWHQKLYLWGTFIFLMILGFILERRFYEARRMLQVYTKELELKNIRLNELNQLKDEFIANTSHELKTPLNGIIGIAESLIDGATGQLSKQTIFNLSLVASSGRRLSHLVNDLLDFSQLKHKEIELNIKAVGLREVTDIVLMLSQPLAKNKSLALVNNIDPNLPPIDADENRLQQILYNLVGNAIKFTESGTVEVSATVIDQEIEVSVSDTGMGIPVNKLEQIFESFEQANGSISREYGGTGLGLTITKQLVQLHGGNIRAESQVENGARLSFTLPLSRGKVEIKQTDQISTVKDSRVISISLDDILADCELPIPTQGAFKILIVDDEPINLQVLVNLLSLQNYSLTQASNGMEALGIIRDGFKPDLILLDVMMPKMTGYELCKKIREQFLPNDLPVVLLTAKNQVSDLVEGFGAGANDYLTKPISKNELLARIKTHIRLAKINAAYGRFVPHEFLRFLERESIVDVKLGDQVQKEMSVLFADIRSFTSLSEKMSPKENFDFLNACLSQISPVIRNHNGFIDKYIGDAIMALFPQTPDDAVQAAIDMQKQVMLYNSYLQKSGGQPIAIGIGLHTGTLMLGTVGESERMETTVIADAVNLASRLEGLTKTYGVDILISEQTQKRLNPQLQENCRFLGRVKVKGKSQAVDIFEVYDSNIQQIIDLKRQTRADFEQGVNFFVEEDFAQAEQIFQQVLQRNKQDRVAQLYIERCKQGQIFNSELNVITKT
ncbi:MAG: ATP-binding protein [Coleofasciculaceae cyanobacterium]